VRAIEAQTVDLALLPPIAYAELKAVVPCLHLLRARVTEGTMHYSGYVIASKESRFKDVASLAGSRIAFVSPRSASGYVFARAALIDAGLDPHHDFVNARFLGTHEAVIRAVLSGEADAGATFYAGLQEARSAGIDTAGLRILAITKAIPTDALVARPDLSPAMISRILGSFDAMNTSEPSGRRALSGLPTVNGWVPTRDSFYDSVRDTLLHATTPATEAP